MWDPVTKLHPHHNLKLAGQYLQALNQSSPSYRYAHGEQVYSPNPLNKFRVFFNMYKYAKELKNFYPYHQRIQTQTKSYIGEYQAAFKQGLVTSAISIFSLYQMARRGKVLPILSQYGRFLKSHRILRHYIWAAILPTTLFLGLVNLKHFDSFHQLWAIHAKRMQQGIFEDPDGTRYPGHLLPMNLKTAWITPYVSGYDRPKKLRNEVDLVDAPDYQNPQFQAVDLPEAEGGQDQDGDDDDE